MKRLAFILAVALIVSIPISALAAPKPANPTYRTQNANRGE